MIKIGIKKRVNPAAADFQFVPFDQGFKTQSDGWLKNFGLFSFFTIV